jgi:hypothetical protein
MLLLASVETTSRQAPICFSGDRTAHCPYALYALLPLAIRHVYKRFLNDRIDETVVPYAFAMTFALTLSLATCLVAVLMSIF